MQVIPTLPPALVDIDPEVTPGHPAAHELDRKTIRQVVQVLVAADIIVPSQNDPSQGTINSVLSGGQGGESSGTVDNLNVGSEETPAVHDASFIALGDSLSAGVGPQHKEYIPLNIIGADLGYNVGNLGKGSTSLAVAQNSNYNQFAMVNRLAEIPQYNAAFHLFLQFWYGVNDLLYNVPISDFAAAYATVVNHAITVKGWPPEKIILVTLAGSRNQAPGTNYRDATLAAAQQFGCIGVDMLTPYITLKATLSEADYEAYFVDPLHSSDLGGRFQASVILAAIQAHNPPARTNGIAVVRNTGIFQGVVRFFRQVFIRGNVKIGGILSFGNEIEDNTNSDDCQIDFGPGSYANGPGKDKITLLNDGGNRVALGVTKQVQLALVGQNGVVICRYNSTQNTTNNGEDVPFRLDNNSYLQVWRFGLMPHTKAQRNAIDPNKVKTGMQILVQDFDDQGAALPAYMSFWNGTVWQKANTVAD